IVGPKFLDQVLVEGMIVRHRELSAPHGERLPVARIAEGWIACRAGSPGFGGTSRAGIGPMQGKRLRCVTHKCNRRLQGISSEVQSATAWPAVYRSDPTDGQVGIRMDPSTIDRS